LGSADFNLRALPPTSPSRVKITDENKKGDKKAGAFVTLAPLFLLPEVPWGHVTGVILPEKCFFKSSST